MPSGAFRLLEVDPLDDLSPPVFILYIVLRVSPLRLLRDSYGFSCGFFSGMNSSTSTSSSADDSDESVPWRLPREFSLSPPYELARN